MDIKHVLSRNPLRPAYAGRPSEVAEPDELGWVDVEGGLVEVGHTGDGFRFDNEEPQHRVWLEPFRLADRLVTNGEWLEFMADGGYRRHELWLSDGWATGATPTAGVPRSTGPRWTASGSSTPCTAPGRSTPGFR